MGDGGALNFGDTFAYALAKVNAAPLLYTGGDFSRTDINAALNAYTDHSLQGDDPIAAPCRWMQWRRGRPAYLLW